MATSTVTARKLATRMGDLVDEDSRRREDDKRIDQEVIICAKVGKRAMRYFRIKAVLGGSLGIRNADGKTVWYTSIEAEPFDPSARTDRPECCAPAREGA